MTTITIDELRNRLDEVADELARSGEPIAVTRNGIAVFEIGPTAYAHAGVPTVDHPGESDEATDWTDGEWDAYWDARDSLATEISSAWPAGVSAVDAIREDRSRLDDFLARNDHHGESR